MLKIALDQFVYTPPTTVLFFTYMAFSGGLPLHAALESAKRKLFPTLKVNWVVWPIVHSLTFSVIPLHYRVLFVSVAAFFWACFLSFAAAEFATD